MACRASSSPCRCSRPAVRCGSSSPSGSRSSRGRRPPREFFRSRSRARRRRTSRLSRSPSSRPRPRAAAAAMGPPREPARAGRRVALRDAARGGGRATRRPRRRASRRRGRVRRPGGRVRRSGARRMSRVALLLRKDALILWRSPLLLGLLLAYPLLIALLVVLVAGSLAAERDENVVGRLVRGLVTRGELVWAKVLLAALVALGLGLGVAVVFGAIIQIGNVTGGEPWGRVPLLALGLLRAGAALGAMGAVLGAVSREARTASLVALLVVLPIVFLGLVPEEVVPAAGWISDALPFIHGVRFFSAALYDASPWGTLAREALWLAGLGGLFGLLARAGTRRLLT